MIAAWPRLVAVSTCATTVPFKVTDFRAAEEIPFESGTIGQHASKRWHDRNRMTRSKGRNPEDTIEFS